jgi:hypothetical protein
MNQTYPVTGGWGSSTLGNERNKLKPKESDWSKLPGIDGSLTASRTRYSGQGRPNLHRQQEAYCQPVRSRRVVVNLESSSDSEYMQESSSSSEEEVEDEDEGKKPPASRVILEVSALTSMFGKLCHCPTCGGKLTLSLKTTCLATSMLMTCDTRKCGFIHYSDPPAPVNIKNGKDNRERSTDYAINVLYIVGFLSVGDGGTEAARLLGLLGLANSTTMKTRSFTIIEERIGPAIRQVTNDILLDNLIGEVTALNSLSPNDFELWQRSLVDPTFVLDKCKYPSIQVSFDMGWQ